MKNKITSKQAKNKNIKEKLVDKALKIGKIPSLPKDVQDTIPYKQVFNNEDGIIETRDGVFTKSYPIEDVNFQIATEEKQLEIFSDYIGFLNSFDENTRWQIVLHNHYVEKRKILEKVKMRPAQDGLNVFRQEMNSHIINQTSNGNSSIEQSKYLTVAVKDKSYDNAKTKFNHIDTTINNTLGKITSSLVRPYTTIERLKILHSIYNQDFDYEPFYDGEELFDLEELQKLGLKTKDIVGPCSFDFSKKDIFRIGDTYAESFYIEKIPTIMSTEFLAALSEINSSMLISLNFEPTEPTEAINVVRSQLSLIEEQIADKEKANMNDGYSSDFIPPQLRKAYENAQELLEDITSNNQKIFFISISITIFGETEEFVKETANLVRSAGRSKLVTIKPLKNQMEFGFNSTLPLCINDLKIERQYTSENAGVFIPFVSQEVQHKNAIFYGLNSVTKNLILYDRLSGDNYNGLIFGKPGTGKSFTTKCEMVSVLLNKPDAQVFVIDPQGEYTPLAKALHGKIIEISPSSTTFINPFDMDISEGVDPIAEKSDYIISMIEIMAGKRSTLSASGRGLIDRCIRKIYQPYIDNLNERGLTIDENIAPTLSDLYNELLRQDSYEAEDIANVIEVYTTGSYNTFAHRTNIDIKNERFIVYNTKNLGTGMMELGSHVCLNDVWNRMVENSKKHYTTWFYVDEFHLLLAHDSTTNFLAKIWKMARKWRGVPTGIMQSTNELLRTKETETIFNTTSFVLMLSEEKIDRDNLQHLLSLSDSQVKYITNNGKGRGLFYNGKIILPFENDFPKDTKLYALMTTAHDVEGAGFV